MKKVYCKKCKYRKVKRHICVWFPTFKDDCFYTDGVDYHGVLYGMKKKNDPDRNLTGDCKYFKK